MVLLDVTCTLLDLGGLASAAIPCYVERRVYLSVII